MPKSHSLAHGGLEPSSSTLRNRTRVREQYANSPACQMRWEKVLRVLGARSMIDLLALRPIRALWWARLSASDGGDRGPTRRGAGTRAHLVLFKSQWMMLCECRKWTPDATSAASRRSTREGSCPCVVDGGTACGSTSASAEGVTPACTMTGVSQLVFEPIGSNPRAEQRVPPARYSRTRAGTRPEEALRDRCIEHSSRATEHVPKKEQMCGWRRLRRMAVSSQIVSRLTSVAARSLKTCVGERERECGRAGDHQRLGKEFS